MKKKILKIILLNIIISQSSSISLYGFGERIFSYDANSSSLGNIRLFSSMSNSFTLSAPSTYYKNSQTNLSMSMSFNTLKSNYIDKLSSNNFNHLSFGFPITVNQYFMLGINPIMRSVLYIRESNFTYIGADSSNIDTDGDGENDPIAFNSSYDLSGGISEISSSISTRISDKISLGLKVGKLFGTSERMDTLNFYKVEFDQNGIFSNPDIFSYEPRKNKYNYSSFSYSLDMRFEVFEKSLLAFNYGWSDPLQVNIDFDNYETKSYVVSGYNDYQLGIQTNIYNNFGYIIEFQKFDSFGSLNATNIFNKPPLNTISVNMGLFYKNNQISSSKINSINYNVGLYDKLFKLNNQVNNAIIRDFGITFGIGVEYLNSNSMTFSLQFGSREAEFNVFKNTKYYKFIISLLSNNNWFVKERK